MPETIKLGPNAIATIQRLPEYEYLLAAIGRSEPVQVGLAVTLEALGHTSEDDKFNLVIEARLEPAETAQIPLKAVED